MTTKKLYRDLAKALYLHAPCGNGTQQADLAAGYLDAIAAVCEVLHAENPRFDISQFMTAAGCVYGSEGAWHLAPF